MKDEPFHNETGKNLYSTDTTHMYKKKTKQTIPDVLEDTYIVIIYMIYNNT